MDEFNLDTEQTGDPVVDDRISDVEEPIVDEENDEIIGVMLRRSLVLIFFVAMVGALVYVFVIRESEPEIAITETERKVVQSRDLGAGGDAMRAAIPKVKFTDVTENSGLAFDHENGARGEKLLPETMGGGCAFLDYDNDGDQDILLINSMPWEGSQSGGPVATSQLYENDGQGNYTDVSEQAGLDLEMYGMGCAVADYDSDGDVDVFILSLIHI